MANISSIGGNPIVPAAVQNNSITDAMLAQTGGILSEVGEMEGIVDNIRHDATALVQDLVNNANNVTGCSYDSATKTVTCASGSVGGGAYLKYRILGSIASAKGKSFRFVVGMTATGAFDPNLSVCVSNNGTGVTAGSCTWDGETVTGTFSIASDATCTWVTFGLQQRGSGATDVGWTLTAHNVTLYEQEFDTSAIESDLAPTFGVANTRDFSPYVKDTVTDAKNGAVKDSTSQITLPAGQAGNTSYVGVRIMESLQSLVSDYAGETITVGAKFTISDALLAASGKISFRLIQNGSGGFVLDSHSVDSGGTHWFVISVPASTTATHLIMAAYIAKTTTLAVDATMSVATSGYPIRSKDNQQAVEWLIDDAVANTWDGKKMSCFGDSYTSQDKWQSVVVDELSLGEYENTAIYGGVLTNNYAGIQNVALDSDILTIWYGTNDYSNNKALGTIDDDDTAPTTFYGALKYVFEWVSTNLPTCLVVPIAHTQRWNSEKDLEFIENNGYGTEGQPKNDLGFSLADYANAIVAVARRYGYETLNLNADGQVNKNNEGSFYGSDHLHPSNGSYKKLGHRIARFIAKQ